MSAQLDNMGLRGKLWTSFAIVTITWGAPALVSYYGYGKITASFPEAAPVMVQARGHLVILTVSSLVLSILIAYATTRSVCVALDRLAGRIEEQLAGMEALEQKNSEDGLSQEEFADAVTRAAEARRAAHDMRQLLGGKRAGSVPDAEA